VCKCGTHQGAGRVDSGRQGGAHTCGHRRPSPNTADSGVKREGRLRREGSGKASARRSVQYGRQNAHDDSGRVGGSRTDRGGSEIQSRGRRSVAAQAPRRVGELGVTSTKLCRCKGDTNSRGYKPGGGGRGPVAPAQRHRRRPLLSLHPAPPTLLCTQPDPGNSSAATPRPGGAPRNGPANIRPTGTR